MIRKVVVLGAGTMGAQVAAHLAGAGLDVALLDLAPPSLETLRKMKPSPLHLPEDLARIRARQLRGRLEGGVGRGLGVRGGGRGPRGQAEAVRAGGRGGEEDRDRQHQHLGAGHRRHVRQAPADMRRRFLGTHFFNPPRYLKLLELIPGPETDPAVARRDGRLCGPRAGQGRRARKDTPNFIANRIGSFGLGIAWGK